MKKVHKNRRPIHPLAAECVRLKRKLGEAELFITMQKMEIVVTAIGWELAEHIKKRARKEKAAACKKKKAIK